MQLEGTTTRIVLLIIRKLFFSWDFQLLMGDTNEIQIKVN